MRKLISLLLKLTVSGLLLYLALRFVNLQTVSSRIREMVPGWLGLALALLLVQFAMLGYRWRLIIERCGADIQFARLFRLVLIGAFFNQTLPSSIGGDGMRIWLLGKQENWRLATYSVLLDRVIGLVALATLVVACLPWTFALVRSPVGRSALLILGIGSLAAWLLFLMLSWQQVPLLGRWTITRHLTATSKIANSILRSPRSLIPIFLLSVIIHGLSALAAWSLAQAIAAELTLSNAIFLVLPVILISVVPISIAGWGVREGAMVAVFIYAGLPQTDGLAVSILLGACYLIVGGVGGGIWVFSSDRKERNASSRGRVTAEASSSRTA